MVCRNAQVRRRRRWSVWMLATAGWVRLRMGSCVIAVVRLGGCSSFVNEGLASLAYIPRLLAGGSCSSAVFVRYGSSAKAGDSRQALLDGQRVPPPLFFGVGGGRRVLPSRHQTRGFVCWESPDASSARGGGASRQSPACTLSHFVSKRTLLQFVLSDGERCSTGNIRLALFFLVCDLGSRKMR